MLRILIILFLLISNAGNLQAKSDTVSVFFHFNQSLLTDSARNSLDAAIYNGSISETRALQIIGYTDEIGGNGYNLQLSRQRAASVKSYLVASGFQPGLITLIIGRGEAGAKPTSDPDGNPADRRVDVVAGKSTRQPVRQKVEKFRFVPTAQTSPEQLPVRKKISKANLSSVAVGETMVLDNIYFFAGRHIIRPESDDALEGLYNALAANPGIRVSIEGHVCCVSPRVIDALDDDTRRMELSVNRAKAIVEYLVKKGLDRSRLEYAGFGHRRPVINPEMTEEDADKNRRVEVRVIK